MGQAVEGLWQLLERLREHPSQPANQTWRLRSEKEKGETIHQTAACCKA